MGTARSSGPQVIKNKNILDISALLNGVRPIPSGK